MVKKPFFLGITILTLIAGILLFYFKSKHPTTNYPQAGQSINESKKFSKIDCPSIENIANQSAETEVNKKIREKVGQIIANEDMQNTTQVSQIPLESDNSWLEISCIPARSDNLIFSLRFNVSSYGAGAAHPNQYTYTLNYSYSGQKELTLTDLFKPNNDYLGLLSKLSRTLLKESLDKRYSQMIDEGTMSNKDNFSNFLIDTKGLTIIFNPYQVAPYSEGTQEILIPSSEIKPNYLF